MKIWPTRPGVALTASVAAGGDHELASLCVEPGPPVVQVVVDDLDQFDGGAFARAALAGDDQQLVECVVQLVGLLEHRPRLGGDLGIVVTFQQFQADRDAGQPGAELVCGVGGEASLGLEHAIDSIRAEPERAGDVVDLVDPRRRRRSREVAVADAARRSEPAAPVGGRAGEPGSLRGVLRR